MTFENNLKTQHIFEPSVNGGIQTVGKFQIANNLVILIVATANRSGDSYRHLYRTSCGGLLRAHSIAALASCNTTHYSSTTATSTVGYTGTL